MGIGGGIALIVIGAILAFGVRDSIDAIDLTMIGYICIGAGVLALILALIINAQRSNTSHREVVDHRTVGTAQPVAQPVVQQPVQPVQQTPVQPVQQQQPPQAPPAPPAGA
ncbi:DUF6458 family protein [Cellulomonas fimi]|uniref:DUF6458 family protein n=1 Tax=Cellulomonas TaxID=1707 RepID=UPI001CEC975B|nr:MULTISPECIES: DUF6458 family protein [Cellulomonas]MDC7122548.1 DUF6458 family protein [Cellulomonas fimi]